LEDKCNKLDLRGKLTVEDLSLVGDPEDSAHRRNEQAEDGKLRRKLQEDDALHERYRQTFRLLLMAGILVAVAYGLYVIVVSPTSSADDRRWASTALGSIVSGALVHLAGKGGKGAPVPPD